MRKLKSSLVTEKIYIKIYNWHPMNSTKTKINLRREISRWSDCPLLLAGLPLQKSVRQ